MSPLKLSRVAQELPGTVSLMVNLASFPYLCDSRLSQSAQIRQVDRVAPALSCSLRPDIISQSPFATVTEPRGFDAVSKRVLPCHFSNCYLIVTQTSGALD